MVENEELPAWLQEMRQQQLGDQSQEAGPFTEEQPNEIDQAGLVDTLQTEMMRAEEQMVQSVEPVQTEEAVPPSDLLDDLREQMLAEEDLEPYEEKTSYAQAILDLKPPQRLLLAILLFFNIALCGCMMLIMLGRVELPF